MLLIFTRRHTLQTYRWRRTTAIRVHCGALWMMFVLVNLQSSNEEKNKKAPVSHMKCREKSYHKGEHGREMCSRSKNKIASKQTNKQQRLQ